jgi:hypothetical protein
MTNTLHRHGGTEDQKRDFIVFAIPCRGYNDRDSTPRLREFLRLALKHRPVNLGDASHGAAYRSEKELTPLVHWRRRDRSCWAEVAEGVSTPTTVSAVFDSPERVVSFLRDLSKADLGLSVNLSANIRAARDCCRAAGIVRHSVEYSLRYMGNTELLAESRVLELATMCGHGMISFDFARKMLDWVREGRRTPEQAGLYLARFCTCGVFNPARATEVLAKACGER